MVDRCTLTDTAVFPGGRGVDSGMLTFGDVVLNEAMWKVFSGIIFTARSRIALRLFNLKATCVRNLSNSAKMYLTWRGGSSRGLQGIQKVIFTPDISTDTHLSNAQKIASGSRVVGATEY
jgi:hypothetical protein